jgi:hypothetical protein
MPEKGLDNVRATAASTAAKLHTVREPGDPLERLLREQAGEDDGGDDVVDKAGGDLLASAHGVPHGLCAVRTTPRYLLVERDGGATFAPPLLPLPSAVVYAGEGLVVDPFGRLLHEPGGLIRHLRLPLGIARLTGKKAEDVAVGVNERAGFPAS